MRNKSLSNFYRTNHRLFSLGYINFIVSIFNYFCDYSFSLALRNIENRDETNEDGPKWKDKIHNVNIQENKDKISGKKRLHNQKDKISEKRKLYYQENKDKINEY